MATQLPVRVAVDLLGGDGAPAAVVDGALLAIGQPGIAVTLVGPSEVAARLLAERGAAAACTVVPASQVVGMDEDPARAVRGKRDATVRVAARLVRDGAADATVSVGSTGAAMAAALFTLGRLPGVTRPALAVVLQAPAGEVVLLDAGAGVDATSHLLAQYALAGAALATVRLGLDRPRVGLLSVGSEDGKGDETRKSAHGLLSELAAAGLLHFIGNVEGHDVPVGGVADVVVTDGFTGNVLLKGLEGAVTATTRVLGAALLSTESAARALLPAFAEVAQRIGPDSHGGGMLLGVNGVAVVGHGASSPRAIAAAIAHAAQAYRLGLVPSIAAALAELGGRRRQAAGLAKVAP